MSINFNTYSKEQYKSNFNYYSNFFFKFNKKFLIIKKNSNQGKKKIILFFFTQIDYCFNFDLKKYLFLGMFLKVNNNFKSYLTSLKKKNFKFLFLLIFYYKSVNNKKIFIINNNNIIFIVLDFNSINHLNTFFKINTNGINFFNNILLNFFFFKKLIHIKKKFFIYKNFYLYHLYWNSKEHSKLSDVDYFTNESFPPKNLWKIFSVTDPLLTFRSKIDEEHKETDLFIYKYTELKNKRYSSSIINHSYKNSIKNYKNLKQIEVDHELYKITRKNINKTLVDTYNKKLEQSREKIRVRDENHELYKKKVLNSIIRRFSKNYSIVFLKKKDFFDSISHNFLLSVLNTSSYKNILLLFHFKTNKIMEGNSLNKILLIYKIFFFFLKKNIKYYFNFLNLLLMFSSNFFVFYNFQLYFKGRRLKKKISKDILLKITKSKGSKKLWVLKNKKWLIFKRKPIKSFINFFKVTNYKNIEFFTKYSTINFRLNYFKKRKYNFKGVFFLEYLKKKFLNSYFFLKKKNYFIFHDWNYSIESYFRISEFRQHFVNINFLASKNILNKNQVFLFATRNLFLNTRFFFNYIYDYWLMRLLLSNNNFWKWINIYFISPIKFYSNSNLFFNLINFYRSNVIIPFLFSSKHYALILKKSKRSRVNNIAKIFYRISNLLFDKIFIKNYIVVIHKTSFFSINKKLMREINDLIRNNKFEIIRYNFVEEFTGICISTFVTKDPKFLIRWVLRVLLKIHFKKQWKFLHQVKINILKVAKKFLNNSNFMGIYIVIKGKIGSLGSVRKKNFKIKFGTFGFSRFYLSGDEMFSYAQTQTGKIGMKVITAYL